MNDKLDLTDSLRLAQSFVRADTRSGSSLSGDSGGEHLLLEQLAAALTEEGFHVIEDAYDPGHPCRSSLAARLLPESGSPSLLLGGHIDTVPLGQVPWQEDAFSGKIEHGRLYGRGSCDMKSGMAALICSAVRHAPALRAAGRDIVLHIYGGEENGCEGSFHLTSRPGVLHGVRAAVIGEPTNALPLAGHKGALWMKLETTGRTAHSSMPEQGENALTKLLPGAMRLLEFLPPDTHPKLGSCTCVLSSLHAGLNSNSVPDRAEMTLDIRTVPGQLHADLARQVKALVGSETECRITLDLPPVWTDPGHPWICRLLDAFAPVFARRMEAGTVQFFTDAAALRSILPELPVLILGPGDPSLAHRTDEACEVAQIRRVDTLYDIILNDWLARSVSW